MRRPFLFLIEQLYSSSSSSFLSSSSSSMAVMCSSISYTSVIKPSPILKPVNKVLIFSQTRKISVKKSLRVQIRSSIKNKVYEDQSEGVICYTNEEGEMICEGYDEGPRFHQDISMTASHPTRDGEIFDLLLQKSWLKIVKGEVKHAGKGKGGVTLKEDLKVNGSNTHC